MALEEDYISFETAKLLKDKGFLKGVDLRMTQNLSFYDNIGLSHNLNKYYDRLIQDKIDFVVAPTIQMAMKWLREVHNVVIELNSIWIESFGYNYIVRIIVEGESKKILKHYNSYEQACGDGIKYCLENLI